MDRFRLRLTMCAAAAALAVAPGARAQDAAGYVASVNGTWYTSARPDQPVSAGRVVAQGEEVWAAPRSSAGAYLNVVLRDGSRLALNCAVPGDCDHRHTLRVQQGLLQGVARMFDAVLEMVRRDPEVFVSLISRADGPQPEDVIVAGNGHGTDLTAAVAALSSGRYQVQMEPWLAAFVPPPPVAAAVWATGDPLVVRRLRSGLYVLNVFRDDEWLGESLVLVAPPQEHAPATLMFEEAQQIASTWTGIDAEHDERVFLRAYLLALARSLRLERW